MISKVVKRYCCEDISLIENYDKAVADNTQIWQCHHRLEITKEGIFSPKELIDKNLYYNRPASELIFLTKLEHNRLHEKNLKFEVLNERKERWKDSQYRKHMSDVHKGKTPGNKGMSMSDEFRLRVSNSKKGKGWYTNGIINIVSDKCPEGFHKGRMFTPHLTKEHYSKLASDIRSSKWWNNGLENKRCKECPGEGWIRGMICKK